MDQACIHSHDRGQKQNLFQISSTKAFFLQSKVLIKPSLPSLNITIKGKRQKNRHPPLPFQSDVLFFNIDFSVKIKEVVSEKLLLSFQSEVLFANLAISDKI